MKKTLLATAVALSICLPVYAVSHMDYDENKYETPDFGDDSGKGFNREIYDYKHNPPEAKLDKATMERLKEDKKAPAMPVRLSADHAEYDPTSGDFHASGSVVITQGLQTIKTIYANGNMKTGDIWVAQGGEFNEPNTELKTTWAHYNINTKTGEMKEITGKSQKDYIQAPHARVLPDKIVMDQGGRASRCPAVKHPPCLSIAAKVIEYYPGEKMLAHDVKVYARGKHIYSRDLWVNEFNGGGQTKISPRVGYDGSSKGVYAKLEIEQPIDKKTTASAELIKYDKDGYRPSYQLKRSERNFTIKYFHGWDEDDDDWYKKQNDFRIDYKPHHIIDGIPISYRAYIERGLWQCDEDFENKSERSRYNKRAKSWHTEGAIYIDHDPIYLFNSRNTVLNIGVGKKWVHESYNGYLSSRDYRNGKLSHISETKSTKIFHYRLGQKITDNLNAWVAYYKKDKTSNLFDLGQPKMSREVRFGLQYKPTANDIFTVVNRYDYGEHAQYETDYRWFHRFCCWALEVSYEKEWHRQDHSLRIHYYFYNW